MPHNRRPKQTHIQYNQVNLVLAQLLGLFRLLDWFIIESYNMVIRATYIVGAGHIVIHNVLTALHIINK